MVQAICKEIKIRNTAWKNQEIETIYFGGGTPSLLANGEIKQILEVIFNNYTVSDTAEITLEANPDDLHHPKIQALSQTPINRLSIGVQSFEDGHLQTLHRSHTCKQAHDSLIWALDTFENVSIDLIYGIPKLSNSAWETSINRAIAYQIPHISCYALTVEPNTALPKLIAKGKIGAVEAQVAKTHFEIMIPLLEDAGYAHYEISNFCKPNLYSKNNKGYWDGKKYMGIGPSAHSYNGTERSWNIRNNHRYIEALQNNQLPSESETLSISDRYNEYVMTGLRTQWGVSFATIAQTFGMKYLRHIQQQAQRFLNESILQHNNDTLVVSKAARFLTDGISSSLFFMDT